MRRGAHRSRSSDRDDGQIRLSFEPTAAGTASPTSALDAAAPAAVSVETAPSVENRAAPPLRPQSLAAVVEIAQRRRAPQTVSSGPLGASRTAVIERSASEWFEIGCELEASSPQGARDAYRRAVEIDDDHASAHLNLGRLLHEARDLPGAERHYRRALDAEPEDATAAFNLGVALEDQGRTAEAVVFYERATSCDPDFEDAYHNLVRLHELAGDKAAALRVLKRLRGRFRC
jgi:tetratricopeptide (TPR) repeat protein